MSNAVAVILASFPSCSSCPSLLDVVPSALLPSSFPCLLGCRCRSASCPSCISLLLSSLLFPFEVAQARLLPRRDDGRRLPSGAAGQETPRPRIVPNHPPSPGIDRGHRALSGHADPQGPSGLHSSDLVRRPELTSPYTVGLPAGVVRTPAPSVPAKASFTARPRARPLEKRALFLYILIVTGTKFVRSSGKKLRPQGRREARVTPARK